MDLDRYIRTKADKKALADGCTIALARADRVRHFFEKFLRHSKGQWAGKPFTLLDWQWDDIIVPLFGWVRSDGSRRFRRAYIEIPKKNGKSALASGIGLYLLVGDNEPGAEVYSVAADKDQASIVHGEAVRMVESSPALGRHLTVNYTTKTISFSSSKAWYKALSSEVNTKEGLNAHGLIVDELHAWKGRGMWDTLRYAGRARNQPMLFVITTAGDDMHSVCREQHDYAKAILAGQVEDTRVFPYIRAARSLAEGDTVDDDYRDPETWSRANPSLGATIRVDDFEADALEAEKSPTTLATFKRYSLNIWSTSVAPWLRAENWEACRRSFTLADLSGRECYAGIDLARTRDMTALVLLFPDGDEYQVLPWFWLPEDRVNEADAPALYRVWRDSGHLETTPGSVCDYTFIKRRIVELASMFQIREIAYDPYNAEQVTQEIEAETGIRRISFGQTVTNFAAPTSELERLVIAGKIHHDGNPILSWQASHVQVRCDVNNNKRPVKPGGSDPKKIDGIVATIMALARAMDKQGSYGSAYETSGITFI